MAKPSLPTSKQDKASAYLNVLFEIKSRLQLIQQTKSSNLPYGIAREVCHLQLRHICELIAIGCLIVQGDYTSAPQFKDEYRPPNIFRALEKYEGFFPQPATITVDANGNRDIQFNNHPNAMTRQEVERLWGMTGNFLHRLKIGSFFRREDVSPERPWTEVETNVDGLIALLQTHGIAMHRPKTMVLGSLDGNASHPDVTFLEYLDDGTIAAHYFTGKGETPYWKGPAV